jgi:hypothetical protein
LVHDLTPIEVHRDQMMDDGLRKRLSVFGLHRKVEAAESTIDWPVEAKHLW